MELAKTLLNLRSLRAFSRELTLEQLEEALSKLSAVVAERREQQEIADMEAEERENKLKLVAESIKSQGLNVEDLMSLLSESKAKTVRQKRPPKYKYTMDDGTEKTWTGQGRTPKEIAKGIAEGLELSDFAI
nr:H-NS family nucleoid-associated regulatory protein [Vibrio crassostreae]